MIYFVYAIIIILADRGIKLWITNSLEVGQAFEFLPGVLRITHVENTGAAFSIFSDMRWALVAISSVAVFILILIILRYRDGETGRLGASFMLGGAAGNLIDRILKGKVTDMFEPEFINFAVFNVADIFVTVGCIIFICHIMRLSTIQKRRKNAVLPEPATDAEDTASENSGTLTEQQILMEYYLEKSLDDDD